MSREVDHLLKQLRFPPEGNGQRNVATATPPRGRLAGARPMVGAARESRFGGWPWVALSLVLGAALPFWPYPHPCGLLLTGYLAVVTVLLVVALRALVGTWSARQGFAHALSLGTLLLALGFAAHEILPRVGYAAHAATWTCHIR